MPKADPGANCADFPEPTAADWAGEWYGDDGADAAFEAAENLENDAIERAIEDAMAGRPSNDNSPPPTFADHEIDLDTAQRLVDGQVASFFCDALEAIPNRTHNEAAHAHWVRSGRPMPVVPTVLPYPILPEAPTRTVIAAAEGIGKSGTVWRHILALVKAGKLDLRAQRVFIYVATHDGIAQHVQDFARAAGEVGLQIGSGFGYVRPPVVHVGYEHGCTARADIRSVNEQAIRSGVSHAKTGCRLCKKAPMCPVLADATSSGGLHIATHAHLSIESPPHIAKTVDGIELAPTAFVIIDESPMSHLYSESSTAVATEIGEPGKWRLEFEHRAQRLLVELAAMQKANSRARITQDMIARHFDMPLGIPHRLRVADFGAYLKEARAVFDATRTKLNAEAADVVKAAKAAQVDNEDAAVDAAKFNFAAAAAYKAARFNHDLAKVMLSAVVGNTDVLASVSATTTSDGSWVYVRLRTGRPIKGTDETSVLLLDATADATLSEIMLRLNDEFNYHVDFAFHRTRVKPRLETLVKVVNSRTSKGALTDSLERSKSSDAFSPLITSAERRMYVADANDWVELNKSKTLAELAPKLGSRADLLEAIKDRRRRRKSESNVECIARVLMLLEAGSKHGLGVTTYKSARDYLEWHQLLPSATYLHYGNVSGRRDMEHVDTYAVIGRPFPDEAAIYDDALAFLGQTNEGRFCDFDGGMQKAAAGEAATVRHLRLTDGGSHPIVTSIHPDPLIDRFVQQINRAGLEQALARPRGILRGTPRGRQYGVVTFDFSDVVADRSYDAVVDWAAFDGMGAADVAAMIYGVVPATAAMARRMEPRLFHSPQNARQSLSRQHKAGDHVGPQFAGTVRVGAIPSMLRGFKATQRRMNVSSGSGKSKRACSLLVDEARLDRLPNWVLTSGKQNVCEIQPPTPPKSAVSPIREFPSIGDTADSRIEFHRRFLASPLTSPANPDPAHPNSRSKLHCVSATWLRAAHSALGTVNKIKSALADAGVVCTWQAVHDTIKLLGLQPVPR